MNLVKSVGIQAREVEPQPVPASIVPPERPDTTKAPPLVVSGGAVLS